MTLAQFLSRTDDPAAQLGVLAERRGRRAIAEIDYAAIDDVQAIVEDARRTPIDGRSPEAIEDLARRFCGEALIQSTGAAWGFRRDPDGGAGRRPCIAKLPGWEKRAFFFCPVMGWLARGAWPGALRDEVERADFDRREGWLRGLLGNRETELDRLARATTRVVAGWRPDHTADSLAGLEAYLRTVDLGDPVSRRAVVARSALYLGAVANRSRGASWTIDRNPRSVARGQPTLGYYSPVGVIEAFLQRPDEVSLIGSLPAGPDAEGRDDAAAARGGDGVGVTAEWLVLCPGGQAPPIEEVVAGLGDVPGCALDDVVASGFSLTKAGAVLAVAVERGPLVAQEAAELVGAPRDALGGRWPIETFDARFVLRYRLADTDALFNALMWVSDWLLTRTSGVVVDATGAVRYAARDEMGRESRHD